MKKMKWISFRVDADLLDAIDKKRKKYKNRSEFLRVLIEEFMPIKKQKRFLVEMERLRLEINKIGTNINQISKNNNSELYFPRDKERLEKNMKQIIELENELLEKIANLESEELDRWVH